MEMNVALSTESSMEVQYVTGFNSTVHVWIGGWLIFLSVEFISFLENMYCLEKDEVNLVIE